MQSVDCNGIFRHFWATTTGEYVSMWQSPEIFFMQMITSFSPPSRLATVYLTTAGFTAKEIKRIGQFFCPKIWIPIAPFSSMTCVVFRSHTVHTMNAMMVTDMNSSTTLVNIQNI